MKYLLATLPLVFGCVTGHNPIVDLYDNTGVCLSGMTVGYQGADTDYNGKLSEIGGREVERLKGDGSIHGANVELHFDLLQLRCEQAK